MQVDPGSGYDHNASRMVPGEVMRGHGQAAVDRLTSGHGLEQKRGITQGIYFVSHFK